MSFNKYCIRATPICLTQHSCPEDFFIQMAPTQQEIENDPPSYEQMLLHIREQVITIYALLQTNPNIFDEALKVNPTTGMAHFKAVEHLKRPVSIWYSTMLPEAKTLIYTEAAKLAASLSAAS